MTVVFFICFGVGVGFVIISFLIGEFSGEFEGGSDLSLLRPSVLATFLVVFGAIGLVFDYLSLVIQPLTIFFAFVGGLGMSLVFNKFILMPLKKLENTSAAGRQALIGHEATVIEKIPQGAYGKITFTIHGNKHNAPAKAEDGNEISRYEAVEIIYIEKNTYFVRRREMKGV